MCSFATILVDCLEWALNARASGMSVTEFDAEIHVHVQMAGPSHHAACLRAGCHGSDATTASAVDTEIKWDGAVSLSPCGGTTFGILGSTS